MMQCSAEQVVAALERIGVTEDTFGEEDVIDPEVYAWYESRFKRCVEDGVLDAINAYVHHACVRDDINDVTKVAILHASLQR